MIIVNTPNQNIRSINDNEVQQWLVTIYARLHMIVT